MGIDILLELVELATNFVGGIKRQSSPESSSRRIADLEARLGDAPELQRLIQEGHKLAAIKYYREKTGASLKEAKEAIERRTSVLTTEKTEEISTEVSLSSSDLEEVCGLIEKGHTIAAIKYYREKTGASLGNAKEAIDLLIEEKKAIAKAAREEEQKSSHATKFLNSDKLQNLIREGHKIGAIKYYREKTGVNLKEAKEAVEWLAEQMNRSK